MDKLFLWKWNEIMMEIHNIYMSRRPKKKKDLIDGIWLCGLSRQEPAIEGSLEEWILSVNFNRMTYFELYISMVRPKSDFFFS